MINFKYFYMRGLRQAYDLNKMAALSELVT